MKDPETARLKKIDVKQVKRVCPEAYWRITRKQVHAFMCLKSRSLEEL